LAYPSTGEAPNTVLKDAVYQRVTI